jgi:hypothetical protein
MEVEGCVGVREGGGEGDEGEGGRGGLGGLSSLGGRFIRVGGRFR